MVFANWYEDFDVPKKKAVSGFFKALTKVVLAMWKAAVYVFPQLKPYGPLLLVRIFKVPVKGAVVRHRGGRVLRYA